MVGRGFVVSAGPHADVARVGMAKTPEFAQVTSGHTAGDSKRHAMPGLAWALNTVRGMTTETLDLYMNFLVVAMAASVVTFTWGALVYAAYSVWKKR